MSRSGELYGSLAKAIYLATGLFIFLWFLYLINRVLLAALLALILALAINAVVTLLEGKNWSRGAATAFSFLGFLGVSGLITWLIVPRLLAEIPELIEQLPVLLEGIAAQLEPLFGEIPALREQLDRLVGWAVGLVEGIWRYADVMATGAVFGLFILAMALFMVLNLRSLLSWYVRTMPERLRDPATRAFARTSQMVIGWVIASIIIGLIKAFAATIFLTVMGIPGALLWAVLAFLGAFVPRVGFYFMTVPPVIVAFGVSPLTAIWTLVFYIVFSEILGNFVAPRIFAQTMNLDAVFVLFMIFAMGYAFGVIGVLIAAPVAGIVKVYFDEFYLRQQPAASDIDERVEAMMRRQERWQSEAGGG